VIILHLTISRSSPRFHNKDQNNERKEFVIEEDHTPCRMYVHGAEIEHSPLSAEYYRTFHFPRALSTTGHFTHNKRAATSRPNSHTKGKRVT
jgi:hypothetical protein